MILRRPSQTDKEAILEMMAEFEREQSAHDGGFCLCVCREDKRKGSDCK